MYKTLLYSNPSDSLMQQPPSLGIPLKALNPSCVVVLLWTFITLNGVLKID